MSFANLLRKHFSRGSFALLSILLVTPRILAIAPIAVGEPVSSEAIHPRVEISEFLESRPTGLSEPEVRRLTQTILNVSRRSGIELSLILGLIHVESSGNPKAVSNVGALGLMQLRPETAAAMAQDLSIPWEGAESLFEPNLNVVLGVHYLARLINRFGDLDTALAAYNFGPTRIARAIRNGRSVPVRYTQSVRRAYSALI